MAADCGAVRTSPIPLHSIWPAGRELPLGWHDAGKTGLKPEVLAWIEEVWTDMRPLSLRKKREEMQRKEGGETAGG
jgi:MbtH protein